MCFSWSASGGEKRVTCDCSVCTARQTSECQMQLWILTLDCHLHLLIRHTRASYHHLGAYLALAKCGIRHDDDGRFSACRRERTVGSIGSIHHQHWSAVYQSTFTFDRYTSINSTHDSNARHAPTRHGSLCQRNTRPKPDQYRQSRHVRSCLDTESRCVFSL